MVRMRRLPNSPNKLVFFERAGYHPLMTPEL